MDNTTSMMGDPSQGMPPQQGGMPPQQGMQPGQPPMGGQPMPMGQEAGEPDDSGNEDKIENYLNYALSQANLAKKLYKSDKGKETLAKMAIELVEGYEADEQSRQDWLDQNEDWLRLAMLLRETRSYPWPKASNVKYPLLATAAMQFTARAYPALVPADGKIVKTRIVQQHASPQVYEAAGRISNHMSYQILERLPDWEQDMDKLLMTMSISGVCFKKTYYNAVMKVNHSHLVYPENFCVNYWAKSIDKAYRKTEILRYNQNDLMEKVRNDEEFLDLDYPEPEVEKLKKEPLVLASEPPQLQDKSTPHLFLAVHTYWDLDEDGYEEPYIIVIHKKLKQVVRIIARWDKDGVKYNSEGKIAKIDPVEYFTAFPFVPNPDGSIYGLGFGTLLGSLNESVNTIINQLIDAGTLSNLQAGFIGKGLRLQMKNQSFTPGEWKVVNATGDDLHKNIFPLPTREPSGVLMSLLQMLISSGNQLASIAEIMVGKMPGQNTPAGTTQTAVEQGMAVFTAIYKRVYRSLTEEFKKLYRLNKINPDILKEEGQLSGIPLQASDYDLPDWIIVPGADPVGDSNIQRQQKMQQVGQLLQLGTIDPMAFTMRMLEINDIPQADQLVAKPKGPPPPDPKAQLLQAQTQAVQQNAQIDSAAKQQDMQFKERLAALDEQRKASELQHTQQMQALEQQGAEHAGKLDAIMKVIEQQHALKSAHLDLAASETKHQQALQQSAQAHQQKQQQAKSKPSK